MTNDRIKRIQEVFHASLERAPQERGGFLKQVCVDDPELCREVESLLAAHEEAGGFLAAPAINQFEEAATQIQTTRLVSHYEIRSLLGKGGMGEVYLATDTNLGRKAALKILPARYTTEPDLVHRFEREAKAASALNHPNILTVYEIGKTEDSHFIATEFIEGETLRQRLARGNLPLKDAIDIAVQIAAALTAAHEAGIIHRDIKPENIMLRPDGYVKVLDFGLAKLTENIYNPEESTTQTGLIMGTPSYMSPEQARGQKVDARTDIWSIGVVLFELVSGARPFGGESQADLLVAILEREPTPLPDNLPPELASIINRALAKEPGQRYTTIRELGQDLKALQHKLALTSGLKQFAAQVEEATIKQAVEAPTLELAPALLTERATEEPPAVTSLPPVPTRTPMWSRWLGVMAVAIILGIGSWYWFRSVPPVQPAVTPPAVAQPKRKLTWWLNVQRMLGGKLEGRPFQSAGRDIFTNGSRFKFNLISPQDGYLYLLNEGPTAGGLVSLNLLYPTPANSNLNAAVAANQTIQTGNNQFDQHVGEEKFWIVWSAQPVAEIEAVKSAAVQAAQATGLPEIKDSNQRTAILAFLNQYLSESEAKSDEAKEQTIVTSSSETLVTFIRLKHR